MDDVPINVFETFEEEELPLATMIQPIISGDGIVPSKPMVHLINNQVTYQNSTSTSLISNAIIMF